LDSKFKNEADLNQFEKRYNFHAHVLFSKFDMTTGKNPRLKKSDMSKIQTISAKALEMQRGELFSKAKRMSHWQLKKAHDLKRDEKKVKNQTLAKQKDLKGEIGKLRTELKELGAVRADYAKLEQVNKELKEQIKQKDLTEQELKQKINLWRHEAINWREGKNYKDLYAESSEENQELKKELKTLQNAQKELKGHESTKKSQKEVLEPLTDKIELLSNEYQLQLSESFLKVAAIHSVDLLLAKNTKMVEKKSFLYTESKEELDFNGFISDLKAVEIEHQSNYRKFEKIINSLKKVLKKVKSFFKNPFETKEKMQEEKKSNLLEKFKSSRENDENPKRGFRR
jgi:DNA repair exonuclease SbcCD ATPase subunit